MYQEYMRKRKYYSSTCLCFESNIGWGMLFSMELVLRKFNDEVFPGGWIISSFVGTIQTLFILPISGFELELSKESMLRISLLFDVPNDPGTALSFDIFSIELLADCFGIMPSSFLSE